jgi:hypothetical protein
MDHDARHGERLPTTTAATQPDSQTGASPISSHVEPHMSDGAEVNEEQASDADSERLVPDGGERPTVAHQSWLTQDDYWQRTTYIALTGRHTRAAPPTRPLPRPRRFRRPSRVRSAVVLALTVALIVLIPLGVVAAQREAQAHIQLPSGLPNIPGLTQPTPTHTPRPTVTPTVKPTATPKKHK